MIKIKQFELIKNGQVKSKTAAIEMLNEWKASIQLEDDAIKSLSFSSSALEVIYIDQPEEECKYPNQLFSTGRGMEKMQGMTFSVEAFGAAIEKGCNPLETHAPYSRYVFTMLDRTPRVKATYKKNIITPNGNIPISEIEDIYINTLSANTIRTQYKLGILNKGNESANESSIAYTTKIQVGNYKGSTPAQLLIEKPNELAGLKKTAEWLKERISTYQNNKLQYDAIMEAITLYESNKLLNSNNISTCKTRIPIYESGVKAIKRKREDHYRFVYSLTIVCNIDHDAPYEIQIKNCYAPVKEGENGTVSDILEQANEKEEQLTNCYAPVNEGENRMVSVMLEKAIEKEESSIHLTTKEWHKCLRRMRRYADTFEDHISDSILRRNENASYKHNK